MIIVYYPRKQLRFHMGTCGVRRPGFNPSYRHKGCEARAQNIKTAVEARAWKRYPARGSSSILPTQGSPETWDPLICLFMTRLSYLISYILGVHLLCDQIISQYKWELFVLNIDIM